MKDAKQSFLENTRVSRETIERLDLYVDLLRKWNKRINLVAPGTVDEAWTRHFLDSAQIFDLAGADTQRWLDLGSGGGFPGAVIAILGAERNPSMEVTLIESDQRKATFLRTISREVGVKFDVIAARIEDAAPQNADIVSARALAPLPKLLGLVSPHLAVSGKALLPKGENWQSERGLALELWSFDCETHSSKTDASAVILEIGEIKRV